MTIRKDRTKPPAPHTDASLLYLMEHAGQNIEDEALRETMKDSGLGTPATRAAIIERLSQVGYITRKGKTLRATDKGTRLISVVPAQIASPEMTGKWEKALSGMAKEKDPKALAALETRFRQSIERYVRFLVDAARTSEKEVEFEKEPYRGGKGKRSSVTSLAKPCPLCGQGTVTANQKAFGCSRWREGCRFTVWRDCLEKAGGPNLTVAMMKTLLAGKEVNTERGRILWQNNKAVFQPVDPLKAPPRKPLRVGGTPSGKKPPSSAKQKPPAPQMYDDVPPPEEPPY